jgi:8-oxo-dGTP pyrophosphatase MutT (NUDIX family)
MRRLRPLLRAANRLRHAYWFVARPRSIALVVDEQGRVLLVEQAYTDGWFLPGGAVRRKEPLDAALRRELREEVGIEPTAAPRLHGVYWNFREHKSDCIVVFVVERWDRKPARSLEIVQDAFFAPGELPEKTSPAARRRIAELADGAAALVGEW